MGRIFFRPTLTNAYKYLKSDRYLLNIADKFGNKMLPLESDSINICKELVLICDYVKDALAQMLK